MKEHTGPDAEHVRGVFEAIDIQEGQPSSLENGVLRLRTDGTRSEVGFLGRFTGIVRRQTIIPHELASPRLAPVP